MIDIDHFKSVNDIYGHDVGDEVIKSVAATLRTHKRTSDIVGRLGGEEFALIVPEAKFESAVATAERFRWLVAGQSIVVKGRSIAVTISVSISRTEMAGIDELMKEADVGLNEAKRSGRNQVCRFEPGQTPKPAREAHAP